MMRNPLPWLLIVVLLVSVPRAAPAQGDAPAADDAAAKLDELYQSPVPKPAPARARPARRKSAPPLEADKPAVEPRGGMSKSMLGEISKVYQSQIVFGAAAAEEWRKFWTKMRDERALFDVRLAKQREGFLDSLHSLDPKDHGQSLLDFETMQGDVIRSFEENQSRKIKNFIAETGSKLKEFGDIQEAERAKLAQSSQDAWAETRAQLNIAAPAPKEKSDKSKKPKEKPKPEDMP